MIIDSILLIFLTGIDSHVLLRFTIHILNSKFIIFLIVFQESRLFILIIVGVGGGVLESAACGVVGSVGNWFTDNKHRHSHTIWISIGGAIYPDASDISLIEIFNVIVLVSKKYFLLVS